MSIIFVKPELKIYLRRLRAGPLRALAYRSLAEFFSQNGVEGNRLIRIGKKGWAKVFSGVNAGYYFCSMNTAGQDPKGYRSPLAIVGFIFLFAGALVAALMFILRAEPTHTFYSFAGTGLAFIALNPYILRMRNSLLWQGLLIGSAITSVIWMLI